MQLARRHPNDTSIGETGFRYFPGIATEWALDKENATVYVRMDPDARFSDGEPITSDDIKPKQHVDIQAAAQKWVDSSISKTANVPTEYPYEDFKDIYTYAHSKGLKGCTTFRFNPEVFQGV